MYTEKSDSELKQLAFDIESGKVFTHLHIHKSHLDNGLAQQVFMPLAFADKAMIDGFDRDNITLLYEYVSEAKTGRVINGYPIFASVRSLNQDDHRRLGSYLDELRDKLAEFNNG